MTFPSATIGPLEFPKPSLPSAISASQIFSPIGIQRQQARIGSGMYDLVVVDRDVAHVFTIEGAGDAPRLGFRSGHLGPE